jgi:hypothetical protein
VAPAALLNEPPEDHNGATSLEIHAPTKILLMTFDSRMGYQPIPSQGALMKTIFSIVAVVTFIPGFAIAKPVAVKTSKVAPFSCAHAQEPAFKDLADQCAAIDMVLKDHSINSCVKTGDDGGYMEYYTLEASGFCDDK